MKKLILVICLSATITVVRATTFAWNPPASSLTYGLPIGYKFYQQIGTNRAVVLQLLTGNTLLYTVPNIQPGSPDQYSFWVTALTPAGESVPSNVVIVRPVPVSSPPLDFRSITNIASIAPGAENGSARLMQLSAPGYSGHRQKLRDTKP